MIPPEPGLAATAPASPVSVRVYLWVGIVLAVLGVSQLLAQRPETIEAVALTAALACGAAVAALPRMMLVALVGLAAAIVAMVAAIEVPVFASFVAVMLAAYTIARYADLRTAIAGYVVLFGAVAAVAVPEIASGNDGVFGLIYPVFYFGGAGLLGWLTRKRAQYVVAVLAYAESLEREQAQRAELVAAAERERLARDMHDVVSHGVSVMVLQAEAAREVLHAQPDAAATALDAIADAGRTAMTDLHRMLGVLRGPNLDLGALAAAVQATGLQVDLRVEGNWAGVDEALRVALYRVAQESLTNTMRHATEAKEAIIEVTCGPDVITLEIRDDGRSDGRSTRGLGSGLTGLADRLAALGGTLTAGQRTDAHGFRVVAEAPRGPA